MLEPDAALWLNNAGQTTQAMPSWKMDIKLYDCSDMHTHSYTYHHNLILVFYAGMVSTAGCPF